MPSRVSRIWQNYMPARCFRFVVPATPDTKLLTTIAGWARELGFQQVGFADLDLSEAGERLRTWLRRGFQGDMDWMARHGAVRERPDLLVPAVAATMAETATSSPRSPASADLPHG